MNLVKVKISWHKPAYLSIDIGWQWFSQSVNFNSYLLNRHYLLYNIGKSFIYIIFSFESYNLYGFRYHKRLFYFLTGFSSISLIWLYISLMKSPRKKKSVLGYWGIPDFFLESVMFQNFFKFRWLLLLLTKCLFTKCFTLQVACGMILNNTEAVKGLYQASGKMLCVLHHIIFTSTEYFLFYFLRKSIVIHTKTDKTET